MLGALSPGRRCGGWSPGRLCMDALRGIG
jgi:hypothetical protein